MRILALFLLPLVAFADVMITPAVMVDLHLAASFDSPVVAQVDYSKTVEATPVEVINGYQWYSMPFTASLEAYVDSSDVAKSLDLNKGALLYDTIDKQNILFMVDDPSQAKLLDMEKGMGHVQFEGEITAYFARQVAITQVEEPATLDEFADVMEPVEVAHEQAAAAQETTIVELSPVEDSDFVSERIPYTAPAARQSAMRSIEGRIVVKDTLFGKKIYLGDARSGRKIAKINKKSPVGLVNLERYNDKVVVLVGTIDDSRKGIAITVRNVRLR